MKNTVLTFLLLFVFIPSSFAQSGWVQQNSGTARDIIDIQFLNNNTGYALTKYPELGESSVLKTTNGGASWFTIFNPAPTILNALCFLNANTGSVCGGNGIPIFKTTNAGSTWLPQQTPVNDYYTGFYYQNSDTAYTLSFTKVLRTTNSGQNWLTLFSLNEAFWSDIIFINQKTGIVVGSSTLRTTNSGNSWLPMLASGVCISNFRENNIMICGYSGIYNSTNFGATTAQVYTYPAGDPGGLFGISYLDSATVICVGSSGKILKTTNNGSNWFEQQSIFTSTFLKLSFINPYTGWIGGSNGIILKTTTGGVVTGFTQTSSEIPDKFSLSQNYPNPFNPSTNINYELPITNYVSLKIYDALGNEVETLVNEKQNAGSYSVGFNASELPSGIYFYTLSTEKFSDTKKMILIK